VITRLPEEAGREQVWRRFARDLGATYAPADFWNPDRVTARHGEWTLTLELVTGAATHTRMSAPFRWPAGGHPFRLSVYPAGGVFGFTMGTSADVLPDIRVGDPALDAAFHIAGTDEAAARALLTEGGGDALRAFLLAERQSGLEVAPAEGGDGLLAARVFGVVADGARLLALFEATLEALYAAVRLPAPR